MAIELAAAAAAKAIIAAGAKTALVELRTQISRSGAAYADIAANMGAEPELDEALRLLGGTAENMPTAMWDRLKGLISQRPPIFGDPEARLFIADNRVITLAKSATRKTLLHDDIFDECAAAREIHIELFDGDGVYGEGILEDAVRFCVLSLLARLTPGDRLIVDVLSDVREEIREDLRRFEGKLEALAGDRAAVDVAVLDQALDAEVFTLRRKRLIHGTALIESADTLGQRLEAGLALASERSRGEAYREMAIVAARAEQAEKAEGWIDKAKAFGIDTTLEHARLALLENDFDNALRLLRDRDDPAARSLLLDAIQRRDGEAAAIEYFEKHLQLLDLTGHAAQVMSSRYARAGRYPEAEALLASVSAKQIEENPLLLFGRARFAIAGALPADMQGRLIESDGWIPHPKDLRDDDEGQRRFAIAKQALEELQGVLGELDAPDFVSLVDINLLFLSLHMGDEEAREQGRRAVLERLADPAQAIELAPIVSIHKLDFDWSGLRAKLAEAEQLGGFDDTQLNAAFALVMQDRAPQPILAFVQTHRDRLKEYQRNDTVVAIEVEALSKTGDVAGAKALLESERATLDANVISFLENMIAEAEGADSIAVHLAQFETSDATHDLQTLVETLGHKRDERLGDYLVQLWERRHRIEDARNACDAYVFSGQDEKAEAFLETLGELPRQDLHLRSHLAWGRFRQGRLAEAVTETRALIDAGVNDGNMRRLTVMLAVETGRWSELEPFVQRELAAAEDRTATDLMGSARIALALDSPTTMPLVRAAIAKAGDDPALHAEAYSIAASSGHDREGEAGAWLRRAIDGSSEENGPMFSKDFDEVIEMVKSSREDAERVGDMITNAQLPVFIAMNQMRGAQSALLLRQSPANAEETDTRRKHVVPLYAGNRASAVTVDPKSVAFDPLAILVLDHLGLLERCLDAFDDVILPAGTLHSFFEDSSKSGPSQPSRIAQARALKERAASGLLTAETLPDADSAETDAVGDEFARLFAAAQARGGYVVDTAPLHPPGSLKTVVDPSPYAERLVSPAGLVASLRKAARLSEAKAKAAAKSISGSGSAWPDEPDPVAGRPMFLTGLAVQYLSDAGLFSILRAYAGSLVILPQVVEFAEREIASGEASATVRGGIEKIREVLASSIASGKARVGPWRPRRDEMEEANTDRNIGPVFSMLRDSGGAEAFVCDDRAMNKYLKYTDTRGFELPFLTTADILVLLHRRSVLDDNELAAAREALRLAGAGLMPLDPQDVERAVLQSDWSIGPGAELRAMRDSVHLPIARKFIQLPQERAWFKSVAMALAFAARRAWQEIEDLEHARAAANYLVSIFPDPLGASGADESPDRALWVQDVSRNAIWAITTLFNLLGDRGKAYREWVDKEIMPEAERRDPGVTDAIARTLFASFNTPLSQLELEEASDGED